MASVELSENHQPHTYLKARVFYPKVAHFRSRLIGVVILQLIEVNFGWFAGDYGCYLLICINILKILRR